MRGTGVRVLVVGAGVAGLATARTLHAWGADVEIIERTLQPPEGGTGLYLPGNAVRALERLGLAAEVAARAVTIHHQRVSDRYGRTLFEVRVDDLWRGVGPCLALPRSDLHRVLLAGAKEIPVHWGRSPRRITDTGGEVRVDFDDGTGAAYDLVVGADGVHSTVRRIVFGRTGVRRAGPYAYRFLACSPGAAPVWSLMLGDRTAFLTVPVGAEHVYCYGDGPAADPPPTLGELVRGFAAPVSALVSGAESRPHAAPIEEVSLGRWSEGVTVLVGDAAHATAPNMAQGAAMAIEDAIVLAGVLERTSTIHDALLAYERRRRPRTDWVMATTRRRERSRQLPPALRNMLYRRAGPRMFHAHHRLLRAEP